MVWRIANTVLLLALLAVLLLKLFGPSETSVRNFEVFPDMARAFRYNSFAPNPNFNDGATLQRPVPGTLRIEESAWLSRSQEADLIPAAGQPKDNPFPLSDAAALARGRAGYTSFCEPCHGATGAGDGPVTQHGYPAPPNLIAGSAADMDDVVLFRIVSQGGIDMPPYASQIPPSDRWRIVAHLRSLQGRAPSPVASAAQR